MTRKGGKGRRDPQYMINCAKGVRLVAAEKKSRTRDRISTLGIYYLSQEAGGWDRGDARRFQEGHHVRNSVGCLVARALPLRKSADAKLLRRRRRMQCTIYWTYCIKS